MHIIHMQGQSKSNYGTELKVPPRKTIPGHTLFIITIIVFVVNFVVIIVVDFGLVIIVLSFTVLSWACVCFCLNLLSTLPYYIYPPAFSSVGTVGQHMRQQRSNKRQFASALVLLSAVSSKESAVFYTLFVFESCLFLMKDQDKCSDVQPAISSEFLYTDSILENPLILGQTFYLII